MTIVYPEPLLHDDLEKILDICLKYKKKVNITTNGVFIERCVNLLNHPAVRQINISLHSENNQKNYYDNVGFGGYLERNLEEM